MPIALEDLLRAAQNQTAPSQANEIIRFLRNLPRRNIAEVKATAQPTLVNTFPGFGNARQQRFIDKGEKFEVWAFIKGAARDVKLLAGSRAYSMHPVEVAYGLPKEITMYIASVETRQFQKGKYEFRIQIDGKIQKGKGLLQATATANSGLNRVKVPLLTNDIPTLVSSSSSAVLNPLSDELYKEFKKIKMLPYKSQILEEFWSRVKQVGAPLIGESQKNLKNKMPVVFLYRQGDEYRGIVDTVALAGDMTGWWPRHKQPFKKLEGTDLWYLERFFDARSRLDYKIAITPAGKTPADDVLILDPLNRRHSATKHNNWIVKNSELLMPRYRQIDEAIKNTPQHRGTIEEINIGLNHPGNNLKAEVYLPSGYHNFENNQRLYPTVYFLDGNDYIHEELADARRVLDNLIETKQIEPVIAVFIVSPKGEINRITEYMRNTERFIKLITDRLVPFVGSRYRAINAPKARLILGYCLGGFVSLGIAFSQNRLFGKVASQSTFLPYNYMRSCSQGKADLLDLTNPVPLVIYLSAGLYSTNVRITGYKRGYNFLGVNRDFARRLSQKQHKNIKIKYTELYEDHGWGCWRNELPDILRYFFTFAPASRRNFRSSSAVSSKSRVFNAARRQEAHLRQILSDLTLRSNLTHRDIKNGRFKNKKNELLFVRLEEINRMQSCMSAEKLSIRNKTAGFHIDKRQLKKQTAAQKLSAVKSVALIKAEVNPDSLKSNRKSASSPNMPFIFARKVNAYINRGKVASSPGSAASINRRGAVKLMGASLLSGYLGGYEKVPVAAPQTITAAKFKAEALRYLSSQEKSVFEMYLSRLSEPCSLSLDFLRKQFGSKQQKEFDAHIRMLFLAFLSVESFDKGESLPLWSRLNKIASEKPADNSLGQFFHRWSIGNFQKTASQIKEFVVWERARVLEALQGKVFSAHTVQDIIDLDFALTLVPGRVKNHFTLVDYLDFRKNGSITLRLPQSREKVIELEEEIRSFPDLRGFALPQMAMDEILRIFLKIGTLDPEDPIIPFFARLNNKYKDYFSDTGWHIFRAEMLRYVHGIFKEVPVAFQAEVIEKKRKELSPTANKLSIYSETLLREVIFLSQSGRQNLVTPQSLKIIVNLFVREKQTGLIWQVLNEDIEPLVVEMLRALEASPSQHNWVWAAAFSRETDAKSIINAREQTADNDDNFVKNFMRLMRYPEFKRLRNSFFDKLSAFAKDVRDLKARPHLKRIILMVSVLYADGQIEPLYRFRVLPALATLWEAALLPQAEISKETKELVSFSAAILPRIKLDARHLTGFYRDLKTNILILEYFSFLRRVDLFNRAAGARVNPSAFGVVVGVYTDETIDAEVRAKALEEIADRVNETKRRDAEIDETLAKILPQVRRDVHALTAQTNTDELRFLAYAKFYHYILGYALAAKNFIVPAAPKLELNAGQRNSEDYEFAYNSSLPPAGQLAVIGYGLKNGINILPYAKLIKRIEAYKNFLPSGAQKNYLENKIKGVREYLKNHPEVSFSRERAEKSALAIKPVLHKSSLVKKSRILGAVSSSVTLSRPSGFAVGGLNLRNKIILGLLRRPLNPGNKARTRYQTKNKAAIRFGRSSSGATAFSGNKFLDRDYLRLRKNLRTLPEEIQQQVRLLNAEELRHIGLSLALIKKVLPQDYAVIFPLIKDNRIQAVTTPYLKAIVKTVGLEQERRFEGIHTEPRALTLPLDYYGKINYVVVIAENEFLNPADLYSSVMHEMAGHIARHENKAVREWTYDRDLLEYGAYQVEKSGLKRTNQIMGQLTDFAFGSAELNGKDINWISRVLNPGVLNSIIENAQLLQQKYYLSIKKRIKAVSSSASSVLSVEEALAGLKKMNLADQAQLRNWLKDHALFFPAPLIGDFYLRNFYDNRAWDNSDLVLRNWQNDRNFPIKKSLYPQRHLLEAKHWWTAGAVEEFMQAYIRNKVSQRPLIWKPLQESFGTWLNTIKRSTHRSLPRGKRFGHLIGTIPTSNMPFPANSRDSQQPALGWILENYSRDLRRQEKREKLFSEININGKTLGDLPLWPVDEKGQFRNDLFDWMLKPGRAPPLDYYSVEKLSLRQLYPRTAEEFDAPLKAGGNHYRQLSLFGFDHEKVSSSSLNLHKWNSPVLEQSIYDLWHKLSCPGINIAEYIKQKWLTGAKRRSAFSLLGCYLLNRNYLSKLQVARDRHHIPKEQYKWLGGLRIVNGINILLESNGFMRLDGQQGDIVRVMARNTLQHAVGQNAGAGNGGVALVLVMAKTLPLPSKEKRIYIYIIDSGSGMPVEAVMERGWRKLSTTVYGGDLAGLRRNKNTQWIIDSKFEAEPAQRWDGALDKLADAVDTPQNMPLGGVLFGMQFSPQPYRRESIASSAAAAVMTTDVNKCVKEAVASIRRKEAIILLNRGLNIQERYAENLPGVRINNEDLMWALKEIMINAIDFSPFCSNISVITHLEKKGRGKRALIIISDEGRGIDADSIAQSAVRLGIIDSQQVQRMTFQEKINLVFEKDVTTRKTLKGGVGLAFVKKEVEKAGGNVEVFSAPNSGTSIVIALPQAIEKRKIMPLDEYLKRYGGERLVVDGKEFVFSKVNRLKAPHKRARNVIEFVPTSAKSNKFVLVEGTSDKIKKCYFYEGPAIAIHGRAHKGSIAAQKVPLTKIINAVSEKEKIKQLLAVVCNRGNGNLETVSIPSIYANAVVKRPAEKYLRSINILTEAAGKEQAERVININRHVQVCFSAKGWSVTTGAEHLLQPVSSYRLVRTSSSVASVNANSDKKQDKSEKFWKGFWKDKESGEGAFRQGYPMEVRDFIVSNVKSLVKGNPKAFVVDLGAGADLWMLRQLAEEFPQIKLYGVDLLNLDTRAICGAQKINYRSASIEKTGLPDKFFNAAIASFTWDYLKPESKQTAIREMQRIIKPAGTLILVLHHPKSAIIQSLRKKLDGFEKDKDFLIQVQRYVETGNFKNINKLIKALEDSLACPGGLNREIQTERLKLLQEARRIQVMPAIRSEVNECIQKALEEVRVSIEMLKNLFSELFNSAPHIEKYFRNTLEADAGVIKNSEGFPVAYGVILRKGPNRGKTQNRNQALSVASSSVNKGDKQGLRQQGNDHLVVIPVHTRKRSEVCDILAQAGTRVDGTLEIGYNKYDKEITRKVQEYVKSVNAQKITTVLYGQAWRVCLNAALFGVVLGVFGVKEGDPEKKAEILIPFDYVENIRPEIVNNPDRVYRDFVQSHISGGHFSKYGLALVPYRIFIYGQQYLGFAGRKLKEENAKFTVRIFRNTAEMVEHLKKAGRASSASSSAGDYRRMSKDQKKQMKIKRIKRNRKRFWKDVFPNLPPAQKDMVERFAEKRKKQFFRLLDAIGPKASSREEWNDYFFLVLEATENMEENLGAQLESFEEKFPVVTANSEEFIVNPDMIISIGKDGAIKNGIEPGKYLVDVKSTSSRAVKKLYNVERQKGHSLSQGKRYELAVERVKDAAGEPVYKGFIIVVNQPDLYYRYAPQELIKLKLSKPIAADYAYIYNVASLGAAARCQMIDKTPLSQELERQ
ncbi:MAG: alpha/beta hydrolase-fold protein, partial [Candidatus Omnitrophica bacterium]|nr:alpha/beta hydrolase-fold protein [Candidatus Omnitrophota bacterium]